MGTTTAHSLYHTFENYYMKQMVEYDLLQVIFHPEYAKMDIHGKQQYIIEALKILAVHIAQTIWFGPGIMIYKPYIRNCQPSGIIRKI